jgi:hypothetical protein
MSVLFQTRVYVSGREKPDLTNYAIISMLLGIVFYLLWPDSWYSIPFIVFGAGLMYFQQFYLDSGKQKLYGYLGRYLTIEKEGLRINGVFYPFHEVLDLTVNVLDHDGEERISAYAVSVQAGVNNSLAFRFKGQNLKFAFHLSSKHHQAELWEALNTLHIINGTEVKAFYKGKTAKLN